MELLCHAMSGQRAFMHMHNVYMIHYIYHIIYNISYNLV